MLKIFDILPGFETIIETGPTGHSRTEHLCSVGSLVAAIFFTFASDRMLRLIFLHDEAGRSDVILVRCYGTEHTIPSNLADSPLTSRLTGGHALLPTHNPLQRLHQRGNMKLRRRAAVEVVGLANGSAAHLEESVCRPSWQCCGRQQRRSGII